MSKHPSLRLKRVVASKSCIGQRRASARKRLNRDRRRADDNKEARRCGISVAELRIRRFEEAKRPQGFSRQPYVSHGGFRD